MGSVNALGLLRSLDIEVERTEDKDEVTEYYARCPHHHNGTRVDHAPSWSLNTSGRHHCFSCGFSGTPTFLVFKVRGCTWEEAEEWVKQYGNSISAILDRDAWDVGRALSRKAPVSRARYLSYDEPPADALDSRKVTAEACQAYGVRWDPQKASWILPILDPESFDLWGWQSKGTTSRLFRNYPFGVTKAQTLFGIDLLPQTHLWVVESPLDAVRLFSLGYTAVSTFGAKVSARQHDLLAAGCDNLVVAMDNDDAGHKAAEAFLAHSRRVNMRFFNYGDSAAKDVGDMSEEEIVFGLESSRHALWGRRALGL